MLRTYVTEIQIYEDQKELIAVVSGEDEYSAKVEIKSNFHTKASWQELAAAIGEAIDKLELQ
jgi:ribosome-associated translation inhibitor RaiA